jgi:CubicO group peptidase (beta-lactamase class C family)
VTGEKGWTISTASFPSSGYRSIRWEESPQELTAAAGALLKTEDMAKMGQFSSKRSLERKQLLSKEWIEEASQAHINQPPAWVSEQSDEAKSDWRQATDISFGAAATMRSVPMAPMVSSLL